MKDLSANRVRGKTISYGGPLPTYGRRERFGPYYRQAVRFVGRALESFGQRLDMWSWGGK